MGGFSFEFLNLLRSNLAQRYNFVYFIQELVLYANEFYGAQALKVQKFKPL